MNDNPLISIIIPYYNTPALLKRLLDSIGFHEDVQIIVIDDNSTKDISFYQAVQKEFQSDHTIYNFWSPHGQYFDAQPLIRLWHVIKTFGVRYVPKYMRLYRKNRIPLLSRRLLKICKIRRLLELRSR